MSEGQKIPDRNHALNVIAADLSELYGWLMLSTRYAAAHEALAVVERALGLPVGEDLFPRRGPQLAAQPEPTPAPNHGPLPGGGFWAGFCERCDTLGCPGDCDE